MASKLAHLSDIHAGYRSGRRLNAFGVNIREQDGYNSLDQMVTEIINSGVDAVVIAGDTIHVPEPHIRELIEVQRQLRRFAEAGIKVYMLGGNHESTDVRADISASRIFDDPWRGLHSYAEPYNKVEIADGIFLHLVSHHMYSDQAETMGQVKSVDGAINIFSTHGSVVDPLLEIALHAERSPREVVIPDELLEDQDWDYILLGHIHERGWVGSKDGKTDTFGSRIYYNGSLLRRGFSDKDVPLGKGWTLWNIDADGTITPEIKTVAQRTQLDFTPIDASEFSSTAVTEKIIENLRSSQEDGVNFIEESAPILRQQITNLTPAKNIGIDWNAVNKEAAHSLMFLPRPVAPERVENSGSTVEKGSFAQNADVVQVYDGWAAKSTTLAELDEHVRDRTKIDARRLVQQGQEANLSDE